MYSSDQVARAFLYCGNVNKTKLNILVYYAQAYWLAKNGEPLFPEDIVVGELGPVPLGIDHDNKEGSIDSIGEEEFKFIRGIYSALDKYTSLELSNICFKSGEPCARIYKGFIISKDTLECIFNHKVHKMNNKKQSFIEKVLQVVRRA